MRITVGMIREIKKGKYDLDKVVKSLQTIYGCTEDQAIEIIQQWIDIPTI